MDVFFFLINIKLLSVKSCHVQRKKSELLIILVVRKVYCFESIVQKIWTQPETVAKVIYIHVFSFFFFFFSSRTTIFFFFHWKPDVYVFWVYYYFFFILISPYLQLQHILQHFEKLFPVYKMSFRFQIKKKEHVVCA